MRRSLRAPCGGHRGVENQLHWVLDVLFGEDQSRARSGCAAGNLALTRRPAINLRRQDKTCQRGIKGKLLRAAINPDYLKPILKRRCASAVLSGLIRIAPDPAFV